MKSPRVSILMPVHNESSYLQAALASVFRQTLTDWELVIVDDFSADETPDIIAEAARRDKRVRVLRSTRRGLVPALNAGLAQCRAEMVARMDGDDISHPRRLETQTNTLDADQGIGLVACSFRHFPRHRIGRGMLTYESWQNSLISHNEVMGDLFVESPFVHPSVMFRKKTVLELGGYRDMGWAEDYDLWLRMAGDGIRFARIPETLFFWRERPERATRNLPAYTAEAFRACKAHHLRRGFLRGEDGVILAGAGLEGRAWRRMLEKEGVAVSLWVDVDPRKIGRMLHGARIAGPGEVRPGMGKMLITVGTPGARVGIRRWAMEAGFREAVDFVCVT
jgi:glycosyltransferase involved in cell wall biosynthesis